jgi:ribosome-binding factor A
MLRKTIAGRLGLRVAPELVFFYDEGVDDLARIEMLLEEVRAEGRK